MFSFRTTLLILLLAVPAHSQRQRCGTAEPNFAGGNESGPSDCGYATNSPQPEYVPSFTFEIPVVFHVIQNTSGRGFLSASKIQEQVDVLNEDFQALPGSLGAPGTNTKIRFRLASRDPAGNPTTGITYTTNNSWYRDSGNYWTPLAWDTRRYLNIYTNAPSCCFGYSAEWASQGAAGLINDRVVLWWEIVGRTPTVGWPQNRGRTATHEVGHYLGLYHTFCGGCGSAANCSGTGDLICDTNGQAIETTGCPASQSSCGNRDPTHNYMDYTDDPCMWEFTPEQAQRMRCTLVHWRPDLYSIPAEEIVRLGNPPNPSAFRAGQTSAPTVGTTWDPLIDHTVFFPNALSDFLMVSFVQGGINTPSSIGTILCGISPPPALVFSPTGVPFAIPIPLDPTIAGATICTQGGSISTTDLQLTNALDIVIGCFGC